MYVKKLVDRPPAEACTALTAKLVRTLSDLMANIATHAMQL
jgi:hypothetical protein